jgi:Zinc finger, C3HC4 type (RING finger)
MNQVNVSSNIEWWIERRHSIPPTQIHIPSSVRGDDIYRTRNAETESESESESETPTLIDDFEAVSNQDTQTHGYEGAQVYTPYFRLIMATSRIYPVIEYDILRFEDDIPFDEMDCVILSRLNYTDIKLNVNVETKKCVTFNENCPICFEKLDTDTLVEIQCKHQFCESCVENIFDNCSKTPVCSICRSEYKTLDVNNEETANKLKKYL